MKKFCFEAKQIDYRAAFPNRFEVAPKLKFLGRVNMSFKTKNTTTPTIILILTILYTLQ